MFFWISFSVPFSHSLLSTSNPDKNNTSTFVKMSFNVRATNVANIGTSATNLKLADETSTDAEVSAGVMIRTILLHTVSTLTSGLTLEIGVSGQEDAFIPYARGITTDALNASDLYIPVNVNQVAAMGSADNIVAKSPDGVMSGQLEVYMEGISWSDV